MWIAEITITLLSILIVWLSAKRLQNWKRWRKMKNKTCGECQWYDCHHLLCVVGGDVESTDCACDSFIGIKLTIGDKIRQSSNRELAEMSIREVMTPSGEVIYSSTLIDNKFFFTKNCAVSVVEEWLNSPAEIQEKKEWKICKLCFRRFFSPLFFLIKKLK